MSLEALVTELTETGLESLDNDKLRELKRMCKKDDGIHVPSTFNVLLKSLSKEHAQIRYSCLQAVNELFIRSHQFRLLVVSSLPRILALVFGAYQQPLPRPPEHAARLKQLAAEYIYSWVEKYGAGYQRLVIGFRFLRHMERVDFRAAARAFRRNDPVRIEHLRALHAESRSEYMLRALIAVRTGFLDMRPAIEEALRMLNGCFAILLPDIADLFADSGDSHIEDYGADIEEIMAVMAVNRHAVDIDFDPGRIIEAKEDSNNAAVYDVIRDYLRLCITRYEPQLRAWADRLARLDSCIDPELGALLEAVGKLRSRVVDVVPKCVDLGIDLSSLHANSSRLGNEKSEDEFEDVPEDFYKTRNASSKRPALESLGAHRHKRHQVFSLLGEPGLELDPTYIRPELLRNLQPRTSRPGNASSANSGSDFEDRLRETAPVVEYGPDLMYWGQDTVDTNTSGLEIRHRFLGSAREDATLSGTAADNLKKRVVFYSDATKGLQPTERREIKACRAPLKDGRLCPRRDLVKCPFHGPVVDRDEAGRPQGGFLEAEGGVETPSDSPAGSEQRQSTVATAETVNEIEWRDLEALVKQKHPPVASRKKKEPPAKSALVDIRKNRPSSFNRLRKIIGKKPLYISSDTTMAAQQSQQPSLGIPTAVAKHKLLELIDTDRALIVVPFHLDWRASSLRVLLGASCTVALLLLANGAYILAKGHPQQSRGIASIAEASLVVLSMLGAAWVLARESRLEAYELDKRLRAVAGEIREWTGTYADLRTPQLPTVTTYMALRDGAWRDVPTLLLVKDDIIALGYGEPAPCEVGLRTGELAGLVLTRGQTLTPELMRSRLGLKCRLWDPLSAGHQAMAGRVLFLVLDTPLGNHLEQIARHHQRTDKSVLQNQICVVVRLCLLRILPIVAAIAVAANAIIYGVVNVGQRPQRHMAMETIVGKTAYVLFPFACTALWPVYWIAVRIFTNACEVVLFDTLQRSKTEYEDMEDIDEFDVEALPPTKDISVGIGAILGRMGWLWRNCDYQNLSRSSNLSETLGNITVICSIDREGTIAEPFCTPEQIVVPDADEEGYAILDLAEQQVGSDVKTFIIDEGWEKYLPSLRPLGLNCGVNTLAHRVGKLRIDTTHKRHNCMRQRGKILSSQDTCLCKISRAIGFTNDDLARFHMLMEVDVFAPFHKATELLSRKDISCVASSTSAVLQSEGGAGRLQMLTDGNVELVLGMCLDYFDGSEIRPLGDRMMAMYYGLYLNALQQDLQCLAFAYRPLALDTRGLRWPGWSSTEQHPKASKKSIYVDAAPESSVDEPPRQFVTIVQAPPAELGGGKEESPSEDGSDALAGVSTAVVDLPDHLTEAARLASIRSKSTCPQPAVPDGEDGGFDYTSGDLRQFATEQDFLRDAVAEQIFLGLITFAYDPKVDVCDFVEDLSIAGIRFVYFSRAKGRQSKSFAERLGLETDWNTCILLSSVADGSCDDIADDGYVEDHDIKAQLPRGIESIRSHLREVDDIPLQISLFAECMPDSTREMINIFRENGDIVCCIGSALKDANTLTFAAADLAVGIEPIPHFNWIAHASSNQAAALSGHDVANDGSISTSGALVTQYALGAALTCIPCPLFLQHDTSLYTLMQVISEARRLVGCIQQSGALLVASCLVLVLINLVCSLCLLPPALTGFMLLWVLWVIVPLLGTALLFVPHDENIMSVMPLKNQDHVSDMPRFAAYALIRMLPPAAVTILVYVTALERMLADVPHLGQLASVFGRADWLVLGREQQWAVLAAQTFAMVAFVFHVVCVSSTLMYRTRSCLEFVPFRNTAWVVASALCLLMTFLLAALLLAFGDARIGRVSWYTYLIAFAGPLVLLPLQDACKLHDKKRWTRLQKLAKLEFKTKLGQHSPLLRRVISKQSTTATIPQQQQQQQQQQQGSSPVNTEGGAGWSGEQIDERVPTNSSDGKEGSFLGIERWPILGRSSQRRRDDPSPPTALLGSSPPVAKGMHRSSQSFSMPYTSNMPARDWRILRDGSKHKRTASSVLPENPPQRLPFTTTFSTLGKSVPPLAQQPSAPGALGGCPQPLGEALLGESDFIGYPPGGLEIRNSGLVVLCEQKSPDVCEYVVRRDSAGLRASDMLAIGLVSWAAHIFFRGPALLALLPMAVYLVRSSLQVYQESLVVIRNVGIQTETVTLAGFRKVRSFELFQIDDLVIHEALQLFEYRYYMAILPRDPKIHSINIMFPNLLPKLEALLPIYHGSRRLLFSK
ncbi:hypothetical protein IW152_004217 [Coemansia sp. BCRC 34962]|nr:hypothetical protein IW152_004217 [Coemansia sp. BCRC 34962]